LFLKNSNYFGNGLASVEELIKLNPRYELQLEVLTRIWYQAIRSFTQGEKLNLMPVITAEAKFTDASHKVTQKLENTINEMCLQIPGFFGRMDVMYNSFAELENGKTSLLS
jgi:hypothetical protein